MPEGPEIVITRQYLSTKLKDKKLTSLEVLGGRYSHQDIKGLGLFDDNKSQGWDIIKIGSKGKFMWMELNNGDKTIYLANSFGMAGSWGFYRNSNTRIRFSVLPGPKSKSKKKYNLYYSDPRNFGTIQFYGSEQELDKKLSTLAPDILTSGLSTDDVANLIKQFIGLTRKKDLNLVKVLMDQTALVSGIGNYLVAEILYDAKLDPHRSFNELSDHEIKILALSMRKIVKYAYRDNTTGYMENLSDFVEKHSDRVDSGKFPDYHPDIKNKKFRFKVYGMKNDLKGNAVETDQIVKDRHIHWVPDVQK